MRFIALTLLSLTTLTLAAPAANSEPAAQNWANFFPTIRPQPTHPSKPTATATTPGPQGTRLPTWDEFQDAGIQLPWKTWNSPVGPFRQKHAPFPGVPINMAPLSKREDELEAPLVSRDVEEEVEGVLVKRSVTREATPEQVEALGLWVRGEAMM